MKLYKTKLELYRSCKGEMSSGKVIAIAVHNEDGDFIGYKKYYID